MNIFRRANINAASGLGGDKQPGLAGQLASQNKLLNIATGQIFGGCLLSWGFYSEIFDKLPGMLGNMLKIEEDAFTERAGEYNPAKSYFRLQRNL